MKVKCIKHGSQDAMREWGNFSAYKCMKCIDDEMLGDSVRESDILNPLQGPCDAVKSPLWDESMINSIMEAALPKNKYTRHVKGADIDVYDVLRAWDVTCPAIQHAVKKLLAPGQRGHKDRITDLREALASVQRGIEMEEGK